MIYTGVVRKRTDGRVQGQHIHIGRKMLAILEAQMAFGNLFQGVRREAIDGVLYTARIIGGNASLDIIAPPIEPAGFEIAIATEEEKYRPALIQYGEIIWIVQTYGFIDDFDRSGTFQSSWKPLQEAVADEFKSLELLAEGPSSPMVFCKFSIINQQQGARFEFNPDRYYAKARRYAPRLSIKELREIDTPLSGSSDYRELSVAPWKVGAAPGTSQNGVTVVQNKKFWGDVVEKWYWQDGAPENLSENEPKLQEANIRGLLVDGHLGLRETGNPLDPLTSSEADTVEKVYGSGLIKKLEEQDVQSAWYMPWDWQYLEETGGEDLSINHAKIGQEIGNGCESFGYHGPHLPLAFRGVPFAAQAAESLVERMKPKLFAPLIVREMDIPYATEIDPALEQ